MRKQQILPLVFMSASMAMAAEVVVHGDINADYATYWDDEFSPLNAANQDIDLRGTAYMDENFSVTLMGNTHSTYVSDSVTAASEVRHENRATAMGDNENRFTAFNFDGVQMRWNFTPSAAVVFGDLTYSAGSFSYYYWRNTENYAVILKDQKLRGVGFELEDGRIYVGASNNNATALTMYGTYPFALLSHTEERLTITPSIDWIFGKDIGRSYTYALGTEIQYAKSVGDLNYSVTATWGTHPYKGTGVHTFLLEPSFNFDFFNLGMSYYQALLADDDAPVDEQIFTEDERMFYVEPSFNLHKKLALGLAYEFHDPSLQTDGDSRHFVGPNIYLYPTADAELVVWGGYNIRSSTANTFSMGMSGQVHF
ncbi:MAG: hypothetical protein AUK31_04335 [Fibrobacteres bacterium CG2_30_45_31]|nr:MAG: hypothetical protein AUK31_04335 [Fibrobacteres bacterium CG2_30_45_31]